MCGIFGIMNADQASRVAYLGLFALQHRGQESAGISTLYDGQILSHRGPGLVADVFKQDTLDALKGHVAIGHVRYGTSGGSGEANIQPLQARIGGVPVSLVHNGNIVNASTLRRSLEDNGAIFQGTADTEVILHLMTKSTKPDLMGRLKDALGALVGAFSVILLTPTDVFAFVDPHGYRPLSLGRLVTDNRASLVLASETCALDLVGAQFVRDIKPGEMIKISLASAQIDSTHFETNEDDQKKPARCIFEHVYFARPDSVLWGRSPHSTRFQMGEALAKSHPADADLVIAIPDSGVPMAMGYAKASGIPYGIGLIRNHYVGRTFIEPTQQVRNFRVRLKLNPVRDMVAGKRLVVIDDSIVRGTTSQRIIELLREAGASQIHLRIGSPPVAYPCFYGIDTPKRKELLAQNLSIDEMVQTLKCDSLAFLAEEELLGVMADTVSAKADLPPAAHPWCTACFSGRYQDAVAQQLGCPEKPFCGDPA